MEPNISASGKTINKMAKARKFGQMGPATRENTLRAKSMAMVSSSGPTVLSIKESSSRITFKGTGNTSGRTGESMSVNGRIIKWTGEEYKA